MKKTEQRIIYFILLALSINVNAGFDAGKMEKVLAGSHRLEKNMDRDKYRHPKGTIEFYEVDPSHSVVEIWPGGSGWYTEVLAPYLQGSGKLYAAHFSAESHIGYYQKSLTKFKAKLDRHPETYQAVEITVLEPPKHTLIAPQASADRVLTFRNVHNWLKAGTEQQVFQSMFDALKPGGILGVVEHRAKPGTTIEEMIKSGYVTEEKVIKLAVMAGFTLMSKSDMNANPKDSSVHPKGVWTLPPSLRLGDTERERYLGIGESDRMTLKFVKPLK